MRIELRDLDRRKLGRVTVDPAQRPTRVSVERSSRMRSSEAESSQGLEAFLNWDTAQDDAGQLRRCVSCGCQDMFTDRAFPQITGLVVTLAFIGAIIGSLGLVNTPLLIIMAIVLVLDVAILVFARRRLVCYRCRTSYHDLPIARYHRTWDRSVADRYPVSSAQQPTRSRSAPPGPNALAMESSNAAD